MIQLFIYKYLAAIMTLFHDDFSDLQINDLFWIFETRKLPSTGEWLTKEESKVSLPALWLVNNFRVVQFFLFTNWKNYVYFWMFESFKRLMPVKWILDNF